MRGRFKQFEEIGRGATSTVYRCRDRVSREHVALKVFRSDCAAEDRFRALRELSIQLRHPNVVRVIDGAVADHEAWVAMEYIEGPDLKTLIDGGALTEAQAAQITLDLVAGLTFLHRAGYVHRDVKPSNVFIRTGGRRPQAVIGDLGAALDPMGVRVTTSITGTIGFIAPEVISGSTEHEPASDLYALGRTVSALASGLADRSTAWEQLVADLLVATPESRSINRSALAQIEALAARAGPIAHLPPPRARRARGARSALSARIASVDPLPGRSGKASAARFGLSAAALTLLATVSSLVVVRSESPTALDPGIACSWATTYAVRTRAMITHTLEDLQSTLDGEVALNRIAALYSSAVADIRASAAAAGFAVPTQEEARIGALGTAAFTLGVARPAAVAGSILGTRIDDDTMRLAIRHINELTDAIVKRAEAKGCHDARLARCSADWLAELRRVAQESTDQGQVDALSNSILRGGKATTLLAQAIEPYRVKLRQQPIDLASRANSNILVCSRGGTSR